MLSRCVLFSQNPKTGVARPGTALPGTSLAAKLAFRVMANHFLNEAVIAPKLDDEARTIDSETFDTR